MKYLPFVCLFVLDGMYFSTLLPPRFMQWSASIRGEAQELRGSDLGKLGSGNAFEGTQTHAALRTAAPYNLARVTVYFPGEDSWTSRRQSASGIRLTSGHAAVNPAEISYGSRIIIAGWGTFTAVDTGTAVKSRKASGGKLPVIDIFCSSKQEAERLCKSRPMIASYCVR
jgi:3D (Asp-Asp-Asp) domain-containing protein